jgi:type VI secretion system protein VasJ
MKPDWLTRLIRPDSSSIAHTDAPADIVLLVQPCKADTPCGEDVGQHEVFLQLKDNLSRLSGLDCLALEQDCHLLLQQGKDLRPAVYLVYAWMRQHGWDGLKRGLEFLEMLTLHYGTACIRNVRQHAMPFWAGLAAARYWTGWKPGCAIPSLRQACSNNWKR